MSNISNRRRTIHRCVLSALGDCAAPVSISMSSVNGVLMRLFNGGPTGGHILFSTRVSRINIVIARVHASNVLKFNALNNVGGSILFKRHIHVGGYVNIVNNGTYRRYSGRRLGGIPSSRTVCVSVNTRSGRATRRLIEIKRDNAFSAD